MLQSPRKKIKSEPQTLHLQTKRSIQKNKETPLSKNRLPPSIRHTLHHHFHYFLTFQAVGEFEGFDSFAFFVLFLFVGFGVIFLIW